MILLLVILLVLVRASEVQINTESAESCMICADFLIFEEYLCGSADESVSERIFEEENDVDACEDVNEVTGEAMGEVIEKILQSEHSEEALAEAEDEERLHLPVESSAVIPTFEIWETLELAAKTDSDDDSSSSASISDVEGINSKASSVVEYVIDRDLERALAQLDLVSMNFLASKDEALIDLKKWLRTYPEGREFLLRRQFKLIETSLLFDFEDELFGLLLKVFGDDSVQHWLELLRLVDTCFSNDAPEAVAIIVQHVIDLKKNDKHWRALFFRIFGPKYDNNIEPLQAFIPPFEGHEKLFESSLNGSYNRWEVSRLFFFMEGVQSAVMAIYLEKGGKVAKDGILTYNLLGDLCILRFSTHLLESLFAAAARDGLTEAQSKVFLKAAFMANRPELLAGFFERFSWTQYLLTEIVGEGGFSDITASPTWLEYLPTTCQFSNLLVGSFVDKEFLILVLNEDAALREDVVMMFVQKFSSSRNANVIRNRRRIVNESLKIIFEYGEDEQIAGHFIAEFSHLCHDYVVALLREAVRAKNIKRAKFLVKTAGLGMNVLDSSERDIVLWTPQLWQIFHPNSIEDYSI